MTHRPEASCQPAPGLDGLDDEGRREYWAALALRCTEGLGLHGACRLLRHFGSAWESVDHVKDWPEAGLPPRLAEAFLSNAWRRKARPEWESARKLNASIILWNDARYPRLLKELDDAPALLYAAGDASLLNAPCVSVVGSRNASQAARDFVAATAEELSAAGVTVVSGMAFGVDAVANRAALRQAGRTIAVLGCGVDIPYPACHRELHGRISTGGLVISDYPPGTPPRPAFFPARNRIVSGLSLGVLVAEAAHAKSGSLITARLAAEQGRSVYVPAPEALRCAYREGTKQLLMDGARPVYGAGDMLADLFPHLRHALQDMGESAGRREPSLAEASPAPSPREAKPEPASAPQKKCTCVPSANASRRTRPAPEAEPSSLSPDESALLALLGNGPLSPDELLLAAQEQDESWTAARSMAVLMVLEVKRLVNRLSDSRYEVR